MFQDSVEMSGDMSERDPLMGGACNTNDEEPVMRREKQKTGTLSGKEFMYRLEKRKSPGRPVSFSTLYKKFYGEETDSQMEDSTHRAEKQGDIQGETVQGRISDFATFAGQTIERVHDEDTFGYIKIRKTDTSKTIIIKCWYVNKEFKELKERPRLFLIIVRETENDIKKYIEEFLKISERNKIPCHLPALKILIIENMVVVHKDTPEPIVQILLDMDEIELHRGDISGVFEEEIIYFKRMAEYCMGELCLPVVILLRKGEIEKEFESTAAEERIPIISFHEDGSDAVVTTCRKEINVISRSKIVKEKHMFDIKRPWKRIGLNISEVPAERRQNEIANIEDMRYYSDLPFDALICYLLIGVCLADPAEKPYGEEKSEIYSNALSMHLLKVGEWNIPKDGVQDNFFKSCSLAYIFEKKIDKEFKRRIWDDLSKKSNGTFIPPREEQGSENQLRSSIETTLDSKKDNLYSQIFYSLLLENYFEGAKQLIETGYVGIHSILVGCVILKEKEGDWGTTQPEKERIKQMQKIFTHQALRILSCMHKSEPKKREDSGKQDPHAGRLLLNHGCLTDAIKTKNEQFLEDNIVKETLDRVWYGVEKVSLCQKFCLFLLTLLHMVLLPFLIVDSGCKPWLCLYRYYSIPAMKVFINLVGLLALLIAYAYMLLFDFHGHTLSVSDTFIIAWMGSFVIHEIKQIAIAFYRGKRRLDIWNILDWISMITYLIGMLLKIGEGSEYANASRIVLTATFGILCTRVLNLLDIFKFLGPTRVIIQKLIKDTLGFLVILALFTFFYDVTYYTILYNENSDFDFKQVERITRNGYWLLFGELNLKTDRLKKPECTSNKTVYTEGIMERCPSELGRDLAPYLKAFYEFVVAIILMKILVAKYSDSFSKVKEKSKIYWTLSQIKLLEEYSSRSIMPIHLQLPALVIYLIPWTIYLLFNQCARLCRRERSENNQHILITPMFAKMFLYDIDFDTELTETLEEEADAALRVKGKMDSVEKDKWTMLQEEMIEMEQKLLGKQIKLEDAFKEIENRLLARHQNEDQVRT